MATQQPQDQTNRPIRVLMLPGLSQNVSILRQKFSTIEKHCGSSVEFVYLEPPIIMQAGDVAGSGTTTASTDSPELLPRAWYHPSEDLKEYYDVDIGVAALRDFLADQKTPFDGVFGFSQGAAMAALVVALLEFPGTHPPFLVDGKVPHPPLKFGVYISGFKPLDASLAGPFGQGKLKTPSLHVVGRNDVIVSDKRSLTLIDVCEAPRVEWHSGGHFIPTKPSWRQFFQAYFLSFGSASGISHEHVLSPNGTPGTSVANTPRAGSPGV